MGNCGRDSVATPPVRRISGLPESHSRAVRPTSALKLWLLYCAAVIITVGCGQSESRTEIIVFAASSLAESLNQIQTEFESLHPEAKLLFHFAGSQQLRSQIEFGAAVDVYVSADATMVSDLANMNLLRGATTIFAKNRVQVLLAPGNPGKIESLADLSIPGKRIVIGVPDVPVGRAARETLAMLKNIPAFGPEFVKSVASNTVSEEMNVRGVIVRLALGEADAGFAYESDSHTASAREMTSIKFPKDATIEVHYGAGAANDDAAEFPARFVEFLTSDTARQILENHGLIVNGS